MHAQVYIFKDKVSFTFHLQGFELVPKWLLKPTSITSQTFSKHFMLTWYLRFLKHKVIEIMQIFLMCTWFQMGLCVALNLLLYVLAHN